LDGTVELFAQQNAMKPTLYALLLVSLLGVSCQTPQSKVHSYSTSRGGTLYEPEVQSSAPLVVQSSAPASLPPANQISADYFTLGSTMDHVASVMGAPTRTNEFLDEMWWYFRYSRVTFQNGLVSEWDNTSNNLKVKLATSSPAKDYFTQGSTQDEVIAVMGTPTRTNKFLDEMWWYYRYSRVTFKDGRVAEWDDTSNNLKVRWTDHAGGIASVPKTAIIQSGSALSPSSGYTSRLPILPRLPSLPRIPSSSRSYLYSPSFSDGYVDPHYRSGTSVRGYFRKDGTYVSPHYRSGGRVGGFSR
jgi:outer membrane protein assembly factor BamE (lipoprotein component of BamABCDE complex)